MPTDSHVFRYCFAALLCAAACQPFGEPADTSEPLETAGPQPGALLEVQSARIPRITALNPKVASNLGGTYFTITGTSFQPGVQVYFGSEPAAHVYFTSSTQITAELARTTLPTGPLAVKVVNFDGRQSERSDVLTLFEDKLSLSPLRFVVGLSGAPLGVGDFNGDGRPDFVGHDYSYIHILLARGRGDYSFSQTIDNGPGTEHVGVGDINGDGKPDLIANNTMRSEIRVYLGRGDGTFEAPVSSTISGTLPGLLGPTVPYLADLNSDGLTDLLLTTTNGTFGRYGLLTMLAASDGHFGTANFTLLSKTVSAGQFGDLNGDGKIDFVAAASATSEVVFLAGSGDGKFAAPVATAVDTLPDQLALGDFNSDGKPDLASLGSAGKLSIRIGRGDGTFSGSTLLTVESGCLALAAGDLTGDGKADLVVSADRIYAGGTALPRDAWLLGGNGDGSFKTPRALKLAPLQGASELRILDADNDGKPDLLAASGSGGILTVLYGRGGGSFVEDAQLPTAATALGHGDLNGDGKADIFALSVGTNKLYVLLGNGDGTTGAPRAYDTDRAPSAVALADVTGDKKVDLLVSNYDAATVSLLPGNGDGTFQAQRTYSVGKGPNALAAVDMNGDGRLDIVTANYDSSSVSVLLNNGTGGFGAAKSYATGAGPAALAAGDFSGDGRPDIVTANAEANSVSYLQGSASSAGALNSWKSLSSGKGPSAILAREVSGDGKLDILVGNADSGDVSLLAGKGDGTFSAASVLATVATNTDMLLTDLSGDGRPDLVTSGGSPGQISVLYGFASGVFSLSAGSPAIGGPVATPDLNGDGKADLLVGRPDGTLLLYFNTTK